MGKTWILAIWVAVSLVGYRWLIPQVKRGNSGPQVRLVQAYGPEAEAFRHAIEQQGDRVYMAIDPETGDYRVLTSDTYQESLPGGPPGTGSDTELIELGNDRTVARLGAQGINYSVAYRGPDGRIYINRLPPRSDKTSEKQVTHAP